MLQRPSRTLWIAAILVSLICVAGLTYGLVTDWNTPPDRTLPAHPAQQSGSGFGLGLLVGIGAGIVIGSVIAARAKKQR